MGLEPTCYADEAAGDHKGIWFKIQVDTRLAQIRTLPQLRRFLHPPRPKRGPDPSSKRSRRKAMRSQGGAARRLEHTAPSQDLHNDDDQGPPPPRQGKGLPPRNYDAVIQIMALDSPRAVVTATSGSECAHDPGPEEAKCVLPGVPLVSRCSLMDQAEVDFDIMDVQSGIELDEELDVAT
eukprot:7234018-Pyramimonas_sp.AAC.1